MITIDIIPMPAPRMTRADRWKGRECVTKYFSYKTELKLKCNTAGYKLTDQLCVKFYLPIPKSLKNNIKEGDKHKVKPDLDNLIKALMDAFGVNDSHVFSIKAEKYYSNNPRIELFT